MDLNPVKKGSFFTCHSSDTPLSLPSLPARSLCISNFVLPSFWSPQNLFDNKFDDIFGSSFSSDPFNFNSQNGVNKEEK